MPYIGQGLQQGRRQLHTFTATASQTTFGVAYSPGYVDVYQNGILLAPSDYTATNGTTVVLAVGAAVNDEITIIAQHLFSVADVVSASQGGTFAGDVTMTGNLTVQGSTITVDTATTQTVDLGDSDKIRLGDDNDLQMYHTGTVGYIDNNTGSLYIRNNVDDDDGGNIIIEAKSGKASIVAQDDEGVRLYYDDVEKLATTSTGIDIANGTGTIFNNSGTFTIDANTNLTLRGGVHTFDNADGSVEYARITSSGYVGIGTASPNRQLVLYRNDSDQTQIQFQNQTTGTGSSDGFGVGLDTQEDGFLWNYEGGDIYLGRASTRFMTLVGSSGYVGIGTTSPDRALHIEGSDFSSSTIRLKRSGGGTNNDAGLQFTSAAGANDGHGMGGIWFQNSLDGNAYALMRARTDDSTGTSGRFEFMTNTAGNPVGNFTTPRVTIHNDGAVSMPSQPVGYRRNTHTTNGWVTLSNNAHNIFNSYYTPSAYQQHTSADTIDNSGRYYAPQAGWYLVNPEIYSTTGSNETGSYGYANVYKNGSNQFGGHIINYGGDTNDKMNSHSVIVYLTNTDYVQVGVYVAGSGTFQVYSPYCGYWVRFLG